MTFREWFKEFWDNTGEYPTTIIFEKPKEWWTDPNDDEWTAIVRGELLSLSSDGMEKFLDQEFYDGYGGCDSPAFCAWSNNYVLFSQTYDGAESICWVPKSPCVHDPVRPGGG